MAINSLSASSKGISGLVSGMDTQQMVESLLSGTQGKIDSANQKKSQLTYKQQMYRDVAAKLKAFQTSFFSYTSTSGTNLLSPSFFSSMTANSSSSAFKVTASSSASTEKTVVNYVRQLAQTMKAKTNTAATGKLEGNFDSAKLADVLDKLRDPRNSLKISAKDGTPVEITLDKLAGKSEFEIERVLQDALSAAGSDISVEFKNGQFTFKEANGKALTISGSKEAMALVGLGRETDLYNKDGVITTKLNGNNLLPSITVTLDGVKKNLFIDPFAVTDDQSLADQLNKGMQNAFGASASVKYNTTTGKIEFLTKDSSSKLTLSRPGGQANGLDLVGIASGSSSKISLTMTLKEANLATRVAGDVQRFTINGVDFNFSSDKTLGSIISEINSSDAGVKISYLDVEDRFVIESKTSGELTGIDPNNPFQMSQSEGNLLASLFGVQPGSGASSGALSYNKTATGTAYNAGQTFDLDGKTFVLEFGGINYSISLGAKADGTEYTLEEAAKEFNDKLKSAMGGEVLKFSVVTDASGKESLNVMSVSGRAVTLKSGFDTFGIADDSELGTKQAKSDTLLSDLGLEGTTVKIGGVSVNLSGATTVGDLEQRMNTALQAAAGPGAGVKFEENTGRYRIFGVDIPMSFEVSGEDGKLFGASEFTLGKTPGANPDMTITQQGQNAIVSINGTEVERSSNEFTIAGLSFELKDVNIVQAKDKDGNLLYVDENGNLTTNDKDPSGNAYKIAGANNAEGITVSRDTDKIVDGLKKFVEEYNKLVDGINDLLGADASYRKYPPLTSKQKESMSDREVELWEEKAKEGLLRNDNTLEGVLQDMRSTLYKKPDGGRLALYDIGITTQFFGTKDNLAIDESKLKQALAENPDDVAKLFTDTTQGLSQLLNKAIESAISTSPVSTGSIVRQAGAAGVADTSSFLYKEIKTLDDRLKSLDYTYKKEYDRYWAQFNKMEQVISQMNQQSTWMAQQFGG